MNNIFMKSENESDVFILRLTDKLDLRRAEKSIA